MRRLFLYLFLLGSLPLFGQMQQEYIFSSLGSRNGLVSEEVTGIQQDDQGFIWIATLNGLQRFDARRFVTFRTVPGDSTSLPNDMILQSKFDQKNRLWLTFDRNRIGYFDTRTFKFHEVKIPVSKEELKKTASGFQIDESGNILVGVLGIGIFRYDETKDALTSENIPFQMPKGWKVSHFHHDKAHNTYWIASDSGLVKYNTTRKTISWRGQNTDNDPIIAAFADLTVVSAPYMDRTGRFWLTTWPPRGSRAIYSIDKGATQRKDWDSEIRAMLMNRYFEMSNITELKDGSLWIMGLNLFARLNRSTDKFELLPSNLPGLFSIRYDYARQLFEDREQNIWISTNKGVFRVNPSAQYFKTIGNRRPGKDTLYTPDVTDVLQTRNGEILISTWGSGIFSYDAQLNPIEVDYVKAGLDQGENFTWCMIQRNNGEIWRGQQDGFIYITHPGQIKSQVLQPAEMARSTVRQMVEDKNGDVWMGLQNGRIIKWTAATKTFSVVHQLKTIISRLMTDKKGYIWVCTEKRGVFMINPGDGKIIHNYNSDGPPKTRLLHDFSNDVIQFNDSLFIISAGGMNMLDINRQIITHLEPPSELPSNSITSMVADRWGKVWVTTQSGVVGVDMASKVVTNYNANDGVTTNSFNTAASGTLNDGRIVFGTPHEWMIFDPNVIVKNGNKPAANVTITRVSQMNKWLNMDSVSKLPMLTLNYDQNSITIEFSTLTFQTSYGVFYMLEGLDEDWQLSRVTHLAVYNYLPPGDYTFKAICKNAEGQPSKVVATMKIRVKSPFWQTWWFLGMLVLGSVFLLYWLDKVRTQRIRATESIRTRIATSLTEDMSNSLSSINISSELAKTKVDSDAVRTREYINQISDTSNRMVQAMYDMVWSINPKNDTMADTIDRMKNFAGEIESLYEVNVDFDTDKHVESLKLDMELRYEVLSIFKEAITNAGKHSGGRFVKVSLRYKKARLLMVIVDDGKGFVMDNVAMLARGISDMRRRATAINASFYIESEINTGTIVKLEMPVKKF